MNAKNKNNEGELDARKILVNPDALAKSLGATGKITVKKRTVPPAKSTVRAAIRASVPDGKLKGARIMLSDTVGQNNSPVGGFTEWSEGKEHEVIKLGAPTADSAFGVSIRGHETAHATKHGKRPRRKKMTANEAIASQIVDDVNIESDEVPETLSAATVRAYKRAHLAVALREVRAMVNMQKKVISGMVPDSGQVRNANLLAATRAVAMLHSYGTGEYAETQVRSAAMKKIRWAVGDKTVKAIWEVNRLARSARNRNRAISLLVGLMEAEVSEGDEEELPRGGKIPSDLLEPVVHGSGKGGVMRIRNLMPKSAYCSREKTIKRIHAPDGTMINPSRYVAAVVSGDSNGLFARRLKKKSGGCVMIDASGSMSATATNLAAICELVPTATVGYYSGTHGGNGELVIYAFDGKRYSGALPENSIHGGNAVDLPAIQWMMKQSKPWTLISDCSFCGGNIGDEVLAHALVERHVKRKELTNYRSLDAAYEAFGGKGNLPNE